MSCFRWTYDRFWLLHVLSPLASQSTLWIVLHFISLFLVQELPRYLPTIAIWLKVIYVLSLSKVPRLCFIDRRHNRCYNHFYGACRRLRNFKTTPRVAYLGSNGRLRTHIVVGRLFGEGGLWICPAGRMGEMGGRKGKKVVWGNPQDAGSISMLLTTIWWKIRQITTIDQHYKGL